MNVEVLETTKNECYVIGDDSKVRRVTKTNPEGNFEDILSCENELEKYEKEVANIEKKIKQNKPREDLGFVWLICLICHCLIVVGSFFIGIQESLEAARVLVKECIPFGLLFIGVAGAATMFGGLAYAIRKRKYKKRISELNNKILKTSKSLSLLKGHNNVKEEVLSKETISEEVTELLNNAYQQDANAQTIARENNYRILRQIVSEYQRDNTVTEDRGYTYSLRRSKHI